MERIRQFWSSFKDAATVFSFVVNLVLVFVLLILATIIRQQLPIKFDLPVKFTLLLNQNTTVTTLTPTHISTVVNLSLGAFGKVNAPVSMELPAGTPLQVNLKMDIPVNTTVSVNQTIPVNFDQGLAIKLGKSGLVPVVAELRSVAKPYVAMQKSLP
ncbi:MAG: hypothetical protein NT105_03445 [Verrucomicrobia bacterium]|nr:hypothetical protein [Verrucomicrobiota bacterium]